MKENFVKLSHTLIFYLAAASVIVAPLFFLPGTSEFFEFNKFTAILTITVIILLFWSIRMIFEKRTVFTRTPLDIPILLIVAVFLIASFASIDQFISLVGKHGRIWPSFLPITTIAVFYFTITSNLKNRKQVNLILWALVVATTIASIIATVSYFGAYLPFEFAKIRSFNPLGIINRLAVLQAFVIPITASWAIYEREKFTRTAATIATLIITFSLILINFLPAYIGLVVALIFLSVGTLRVKLTKAQQGTVAVLLVFTILFLVVRFIPQVARGTLYSWIATKEQGVTEEEQINTPKEKIAPQRASWDIAAQAIGKRPILGTGPGTFQFIYSQLKPRTVNQTDDWATRFEKPSSEFTEIVATLGILGTLAFLLLAVTLLRFIWALIFKSQNTIIYLPLASALISYIVANFFVVSSFATAHVFFISAALLSVLAKVSGENHVFDVTVELAALKNRFAWFPLGTGSGGLIRTEEGAKGAKSQILPWLFLIFTLVLSVIALNYQLKAYQAEYYYRQSLLAARSNDGNKTINMLQRAVAANPGIDTYHRALSETALNAALNLSRQQNLNDNQKQLLSQLAQVSIDQGKAASGYQILPLRLPGISAANAANWEILSNVYQALIGVVQGADVHATNTLAQAISLDPQNPILHNRLGSLYQRLGNNDLAQRKYEDAIIVKGDFGPAHYNLANILIEKEGDVARIASELTIAKRVLPGEDPAISDIDKKLDEYNKKLRELQQSAKNQNQEPQQNKEGETGSPSPSPSPTPEASASPTPSPSF